MKIISVVGARPNFMKIAPFIRAIDNHNSTAEGEKIDHILVHTGQHYDDRMSKVFFESLGITEAAINLGIGSGSHAEQVGRTMIEFEKVLIKHLPDWVVVVGDVNDTLACSVTAKKLGIQCCHIEADLRSGDMSMPEEINRIVTDRLCDLLLTPDLISSENLKKEGIGDRNIKFVGNIMVDTLDTNLEKAESLHCADIINENYLIPEENGCKFSDKSDYALITIHRPSNVDNREILSSIIGFFIEDVCSKMQIVWPVHPRTLKLLKEFNLLKEISRNESINLINPLNYHEMLKISMNASVILTDSGGLQEESAVLGTPCLTLRWNTERPVTLRENSGTSVLTGNNPELLRKEFNLTLGKNFFPKRPDLWDGMTA